MCEKYGLCWVPLTLLVVASLIAPSYVFADTLQPYPGMQQVASSDDEDNSSRRLILGSLKKINNVLEPEKVEFIVGSRSSRTYYVPDERKTDVLFGFYRKQLAELGDILFECAGRECGSSNYWANSVFSRSVLYGPEQFQRYLLAELTGTGDHVAVYIAMRGTKKLYVHVETTSSGEQDIGAQLLAQGRFVFEGSDIDIDSDSDIDIDIDEIALSVTSLLKDTSMSIHLVVHHGVSEARSFEDTMAFSQTTASQIRDKVIASGIADKRIAATGLGPLAPSTQYGANRVEVLLLQNLSSATDAQ